MIFQLIWSHPLHFTGDADTRRTERCIAAQIMFYVRPSVCPTVSYVVAI